MKTLVALVAIIKALLARGGSGAYRRKADEEIAQKATHGMEQATKIREANETDFSPVYEKWHDGKPPKPPTPRENHQHAANARRGRIAEWSVLVLKVVFWVLFGPVYFAVLAGIAVLIALGVSIPLSWALKTLIAKLILKPGLTPQQLEKRLHTHLVAGIIAFVVSFGSLFLLRGLVGPLALIGGLFILPVLSVCDLVLLYLMGIAQAYVSLYAWARPFVLTDQEATRFIGEFEHYRDAAQRRLDSPAEGPSLVSAAPESPKPTEPNVRTIIKSTTAGIVALMIGVACAASTARAQEGDILFDSTTSVFPEVAERFGPALANSFYAWSEQAAVKRLRVFTFEKDGWFPRQVGKDIEMEGTPVECISAKSDGTIFRGIAEAREQQCNMAKSKQAAQAREHLTKLAANAWHAAPLVVTDKKEVSCTAFFDALAAVARRPVGDLVVLVTDSEETCSKKTSAVPKEAAGANVVVVLVPSKYDMGQGVSAAARFETKRTQLLKIAPWIRAVLAPTDLERDHPSPVPPPVPRTVLVTVRKGELQ